MKALLKVLLKADLAIRSLAATSHGNRELSRGMLALRAKASWFMHSARESLAGKWMCKSVVRAVVDGDDMLARMSEALATTVTLRFRLLRDSGGWANKQDLSIGYPTGSRHLKN